ncbi:MAG: hypothetical protein HYY04_11850 [Chloroflexi bacterium]|nr:hypothetical protein [Chloroflexota bacterium]
MRPDLASYVVFGPAQTTLGEMVRVAGSHWAVKGGFHLIPIQVAPGP